jgi:hypothetical protein
MVEVEDAAAVDTYTDDNEQWQDECAGNIRRWEPDGLGSGKWSQHCREFSFSGCCGALSFEKEAGSALISGVGPDAADSNDIDHSLWPVSENGGWSPENAESSEVAGSETSTLVRAGPVGRASPCVPTGLKDASHHIHSGSRRYPGHPPRSYLKDRCRSIVNGE